MKQFIETLPNQVTLEMVVIPTGRFLMGSPCQNENPQHIVKVNSFAIGKYPVTQSQYQSVMGINPSYFQGNPQNPVESVSWDNAQAFCQKLSQITGKTYRLPTEAEWEYACRAGTTTRYYFGDGRNLRRFDEYFGCDIAYFELEDYAWYEGNSWGRTQPVGQKKPNAWGLHDMVGNVWEWCEDHWNWDYNGAPTDGSAWIEGEYKQPVLRGGSWSDEFYFCYSATRNYSNSTEAFEFFGFRVACSI